LIFIRGDRLFTHFVEPSGLCPILYYNKNSLFERGAKKMSDPLTTSLLVSLAIQEFVKSGTGDLAKRFTVEALAKIPEL